MSSILNALTNTDRQKISAYIDSYAGALPEMRPKSYDIDYILRHWAFNKAPIFEKFGNKLIIEKQIEFYEDHNDLYKKMDKVCNDNCDFICTILEVFEKEKKEYFNFPYCYWESSEELEINHKRHEDLRFIYDMIFSGGLFNLNNLIANKFIVFPLGYSRGIIPLKNGKNLVVSPTDKPMRIIKKIVDSYELDEEAYEKFRIEHSMAINTKLLKGELNISIHPLDFMTMSDNSCDWRSCMNWMNRGEFRQGTVEMMNSPCVVEAYLTSDKPFHLGAGIGTWTNKKWRCLFIMTDDIIMSVREYPYSNANLVKKVIKTLAEINGFNPKSEIAVWNSEDISNIEFNNGCMYNDITEGTYCHTILVNKDSVYRLDDNSTSIFIEYCGPTECMCCGKDIEDINKHDAGRLVCDKCWGVKECENCGCGYGIESMVFIDEHYYCPGCYYNLYVYSSSLETNLSKEESVYVYQVSKKDYENGTYKEVDKIDIIPKDFLYYEKTKVKGKIYKRNTYFKSNCIFKKEKEDSYLVTKDMCTKEFISQFAPILF